MTGAPFHHRIITCTLGVALLFLIASVDSVHGQSPNWAFPTKSLFVGELQNFYHAGGAKPHVGGCDGLSYPGWWRYTCNQTGEGLWFMAKDFTGEGGEEWRHKVAHIGDRPNGVGEVFPQTLELTAKFEPPSVFVDDFRTFRWPVFYENVDEDMSADGMVTNVVNSLIGLTMNRTVYAFSNEYHDNYHVVEDVYTNTGNIEEGRSVPEQTLSDVYIVRTHRYEVNEVAGNITGGGAGWGRNMINDVLDDDLEDYDLRSQYSWLAREPQFTSWDNMGGPALTDEFALVLDGDSVGRLTGANFAGFATLHADVSPSNSEDDPNQPVVEAFIGGGSQFTLGDTRNTDLMANEYRLVEGQGIGGEGDYGSQADVVAGPPNTVPEPENEWRTRMANQVDDPSLGNISGYNSLVAYGPYQLDPGESVRIVWINAVAGLSREAALSIGKQYKRLHRRGEGDEPIEYDADGDGQIEADERMPKNEWVMTSRDSLLKTFRRARANFESGYSIPRPPKPPRQFRVTSGPDKILLEWDVYPDASPIGYELYRTVERPEGDYLKGELIAGVDELGPDARRYEDTSIERGLAYYYYIKAVGDVNEDPTGMTPTGVRLRSNRAYTQTYDPAFLKREPGANLEAARIVPNPFTLTSSGDVRWPGQEYQIGFLDIPGQCTISIYTETGERVETIEHTDGSGDEYWDLTTYAHQLVVSGIYWAVIQDHQSGEQVIKRFVVIR